MLHRACANKLPVMFNPDLYCKRDVLFIKNSNVTGCVYCFTEPYV